MTDSKFTPGPWRFGNTGPEQRMILDANDNYVCSIQIKQCGGGIIAEAMEGSRKRNAAAILCLPDLVDTLAGLVDGDVSYQGSSIVIPCGSHMHAIERIRVARGALAKARGES
jgi:hypothetical protein